MKRILQAAGLSFVMAMSLMGVSKESQAHGPTRQKVTETIQIDAPPDKVWAVVKDFNALHTWLPPVVATEATKGNEIGSVRTLTLDGGAKVIEELKKYDAEQMSFFYRMTDPGPVPVTNYSSWFSLKAKDGGTEVEWKGAFYRAYPNNDPPPEQNDEAAIKAITGIYQGGLANLKKMVEGK